MSPLNCHQSDFSRLYSSFPWRNPLLPYLYTGYPCPPPYQFSCLGSGSNRPCFWSLFRSLPLVRCFLAGIIKLRPALPRYASTFDTKQVLCCLDTIQTSLLTLLKEFGHKLAMLLCLLSDQCIQFIAALDIIFMHLTDN